MSATGANAPHDQRRGTILPLPHGADGWTAAMLAGFRDGDPAVLAEVYRRHVGDVVRLLRGGFTFSSAGQSRRFLGLASPSDLQDAVQETFRRAFEPAARAHFDGIRPYAPYLGMIARNVVLGEIRRQARRFPVETLEPSRDLASHDNAQSAEVEDAFGPARWIHEAQVRSLVESFLRGLAPLDRELLALRFHQGLSQRDVSDRLGLGRQVVRTRELAIRRELLAFLRERGELGLVEGAIDGAVVLLGLSLVRLLGEGLR